MVSSTSLHDVVLKNRSVIGTLQLLRSVTPADVKWQELEKDRGQGKKVTRKSVVRVMSSQLLILKKYFQMLP